MPSILEIANLHVSIGEKEIVKGLSLTIKSGEIHAVMGPNGTGKSTLVEGHRRPSRLHGDRRRHPARWKVHPRRWSPTNGPAPAFSSHSSTRARSPASASPISCGPPSRPTWAKARNSTRRPITSGSTRRWTFLRSTGSSPRAPSTRGSRAARRSAARSSRWRCSSRSSR